MLLTRRPIFGMLAGAVAYRDLPTAPLPEVDFPSIVIEASLPGANPRTMAAAVAAPLERALGSIAGVTELSSTSGQGSAEIRLVFELDRDINDAARDVQAAINASRGSLPSGTLRAELSEGQSLPGAGHGPGPRLAKPQAWRAL